jgi:hypothetical protein
MAIERAATNTSTRPGPSNKTVGLAKYNQSSQPTTQHQLSQHRRTIQAHHSSIALSTKHHRSRYRSQHRRLPLVAAELNVVIHILASTDWQPITPHFCKALA